MKSFTEDQVRSVGKVITWRVLLTIMNFVYTFAVTGNVKAGLAVAGIAAIINSFIYWTHERVWNSVQWGKEVKDVQDFDVHP